MRSLALLLPCLLLQSVTSAPADVRLISHRGNLESIGHLGAEENLPARLLSALSQGYDVELDVRLVPRASVPAASPHLADADGHAGLIYALGHDSAEHHVPLALLAHPHVWVHAKNPAALGALAGLPLNADRPHFFWHDADDYTLTSEGVVWIYPDKPLPGGEGREPVRP